MGKTHDFIGFLFLCVGPAWMNPNWAQKSRRKYSFIDKSDHTWGGIPKIAFYPKNTVNCFHGSGNCSYCPNSHSHSHSHFRTHRKIKNRIPLSSSLTIPYALPHIHRFIFIFSFFIFIFFFSWQLQRTEAKTRLPCRLGIPKRRRRSHPSNLHRRRLPLRRPPQPRPLRHCPRRRRRQVHNFLVFYQ